jgi:hypothetical protein
MLCSCSFEHSPSNLAAFSLCLCWWLLAVEELAHLHSLQLSWRAAHTALPARPASQEREEEEGVGEERRLLPVHLAAGR